MWNLLHTSSIYASPLPGNNNKNARHLLIVIPTPAPANKHIIISHNPISLRNCRQKQLYCFIPFYSPVLSPAFCSVCSITLLLRLTPPNMFTAGLDTHSSSFYLLGYSSDTFLENPTRTVRTTLQRAHTGSQGLHNPSANDKTKVPRGSHFRNNNVSIYVRATTSLRILHQLTNPIILPGKSVTHKVVHGQPYYDVSLCATAFSNIRKEPVIPHWFIIWRSVTSSKLKSSLRNPFSSYYIQYCSLTSHRHHHHHLI